MISVNFMRSCVASQNTLVSAVVSYGVVYGRYNSPVGRNMLFCAQRYACTVEQLICCPSVAGIVTSYVHACYSHAELQTVGFLRECLMVRDARATLSAGFTSSDMSDILLFLCTS